MLVDQGQIPHHLKVKQDLMLNLSIKYIIEPWLNGNNLVKVQSALCTYILFTHKYKNTKRHLQATLVRKQLYIHINHINEL